MAEIPVQKRAEDFPKELFHGKGCKECGKCALKLINTNNSHSLQPDAVEEKDRRIELAMEECCDSLGLLNLWNRTKTIVDIVEASSK